MEEIMAVKPEAEAKMTQRLRRKKPEYPPLNRIFINIGRNVDG
jgi:hypothetical protein